MYLQWPVALFAAAPSGDSSPSCAFSDGNNQESSGEAVAAWEAVVRWGLVRQNPELVTSGVTHYALEAATARAYWLGEGVRRPGGGRSGRGAAPAGAEPAPRGEHQPGIVRYWVELLDAYGPPQPDVVADGPYGLAFGDRDHPTVVAVNPTGSGRTVRFRGGDGEVVAELPVDPGGAVAKRT